MINKKIGVLLLFALLVSFGAKAQRATSMRINEVLVINEDNFVDDYGKRHAWIELFNNSAGSVNIAGCYLTNDKSNPKVSDSEGRRSNSNSSSPAHFVLGRRRTGSGNIPCQFHARPIKRKLHCVIRCRR